MTIRPGINAVRLAAALCAVSLLGFVTPHAVWLLLAGMVVGLILARRDYLRLRDDFDRLQFRRICPAVVGRGESFPVTWSLSTPQPVRLSGECRDLVPAGASPRLVLFPFSLHFPAHARRHQRRPADPLMEIHRAGPGVESVTMRFVIPVRGLHQFGPVWIRLQGAAGFLDAMRSLPATTDVRVLPETLVSPDRFRKEVGAEIRMLDKPVFSRQHGEGTEFESLHEYRSSDDPRRMDWRATARMQRPIIRRFQIERHRDVMILIDCGRLMGSHTERGTKLDCAIDAGLMLGRVALEGGDRCGVGLFDHAVRGYLPPVSGLPSMKALVESAYAAGVTWSESDFAPMFATLQARQAKRSLLVVISDLTDEQTAQPFSGSLRHLARRHVVLFAALRTPLLERTVLQPIDSLLDGSKTAVAMRLLQEREAALQSLRQAGIHVLDVEPDRLAPPLINRFLAIRRHNRL